MRIRKRQVPLPLSSLSPVPLSDPLLHDLNNSSPPPPSTVVQQLHTHHDDRSPTQPKPPNSNNPVEETAHVGHLHHQPSDHRLNPDSPSIRGGAPKGWGFSGNQRVHKKDCGLELLELKEEKEEEEDGGGSQEGDDIRNESISGAEALLAFASGSSSSSHRALGRWYEGENAFPLKKPRGRVGETILMDGQKDTKLDENGEARQGVDRVKVGCSNANAIRKRARISGAIMEGSQCSRVNGRGWRCCQQTLVGYSLCEHHLGKGRLRSMTSVRSRSMTSTTNASTRTRVKRLSTSRLLSLESALDEEEEEEDMKGAVLLDDHDTKGENEEIEVKPLMGRRRRMKLGVVKARSLSSLLGQTKSENIVAVAADDDDENNR